MLQLKATTGDGDPVSPWPSKGDRGEIAHGRPICPERHGIEYTSSPGFGGALAYFHLRKRYPVEHECIDREMTQGIRTSFDEFMNMETEHDRAEAQLEIESVERGMRKREESIRKEQELRQQWHELGGKS